MNKLTSIPGYTRGFSLFEMVAFIIVTAIIYSVAVNRFSDYPEAAERANFLAVLTQIQTGVNLEIMLGVGSGMVRNVREYEDLNPMDLMLLPPSNYLGAFDFIDESRLPRRSWYFDNRTTELVYLVNAADNVYLLQNSVEYPATEIRFGIFATYRDPVTLRNVTYGEMIALREERQLDPEQDSDLDPDRDPAAGEIGVGNARISGAVLRPVTPYKWEGVGIGAADLVNTG